jgi:hypothetical protein
MAVVIAVTVFTPTFAVVFVDPVFVGELDWVAEGVTSGVELGLESSRHALEPSATVKSALDPPCPFDPSSDDVRMNCVPAAMLTFQTIRS